MSKPSPRQTAIATIARDYVEGMVEITPDAIVETTEQLLTDDAEALIEEIMVAVREMDKEAVAKMVAKKLNPPPKPVLIRDICEFSYIDVTEHVGWFSGQCRRLVEQAAGEKGVVVWEPVPPLYAHVLTEAEYHARARVRAVIYA